MHPWPTDEIIFMLSLLVLTWMTTVLLVVVFPNSPYDSTLRFASMSDALVPGKQCTVISDANLTLH